MLQWGLNNSHKFSYRYLALNSDLPIAKDDVRPRGGIVLYEDNFGSDQD